MTYIDIAIGYSTVKIKTVSDRYWLYYNLRVIEQLKLYNLLFYINCLSVVWKHVASDHGSATALNREFLGIVLFIFVYINVMYYF